MLGDIWRRHSWGPPLRCGGYLVPAAVVLRGGTVVLQDFGDRALIDALEVQLPLPEFQETAENRGTSPLCCSLPNAALQRRTASGGGEHVPS